MSLAIIIGECLLIFIVFYIGIKQGRKLFSKKQEDIK